MKKIVAVLAVLICLAAFPAWAKEQRVNATSQLMIEIDHSFWPKEIISGYVYGTAFYNTADGYSALFGYGGPRFGKEAYGAYLLMAVMGDKVGLSVGPSLWLEYTLKKRYYFFLEGDYYIPTAGTTSGNSVVLPQHFYYSQGEASRQFKDEIKFGLAYEMQGLFKDSSPSEVAFGPFGQFKKLRIWIFWDTTPILNGEDIIGIRFKYKI